MTEPNTERLDELIEETRDRIVQHARYLMRDKLGYRGRETWHSDAAGRFVSVGPDRAHITPPSTSLVEDLHDLERYETLRAAVQDHVRALQKETA